MIFEERKNLDIKAEKKTLRKYKSCVNPKDDKAIIKKFDIHQDSISNNNNDGNSNIDKKKLKLFSFYIKSLSEQALLNYGISYLKSFISKDIVIPHNFMEKHKISSFIRTKMVNWMLEILYTFHSNEETFLAAVDIMDKFIYHYKKKVLKDENIHLIGIVSLYIASKVYDLIPIQLDNIIHQIGHDQFSQKEILNLERKIIKTIDFDVFFTNSFELIRFLIYDFYVNNKDNFKTLNANKYMDMLTNNSIWIYKMCKHFEYFSSIRPLLLSISCLLIGYDILRDNCAGFKGEIKDFFKKWLSFLFSSVGKTKQIKEKIESIYKKIQNSYNDYRNSTFNNLVHYHALYLE
jgi:hypothetical protein